MNIYNFILENNIDTLIVHGLLKINHTHRFIHHAIYKIFSYISIILSEKKKINVIWLDDKKTDIYDKLENNVIVFSSPHYNTDNHLPIKDNIFYILHFNTKNYITNQPITKYDNLLLQKKAVKYVEFRYKNKEKQIDDTIYWYDETTNALHMPWATNLTPNDILKKIKLVEQQENPVNNNICYYCGSIWFRNKENMNKWKNICNKYNIKFELKREMNENKHQQDVFNSYMAPAIQGESHKDSEDKFYIPCRIFKNISYGNIAVTNNKGVYNLFKDNLIIYDDDLEKLMIKYIEYMKKLKNPENFKKHKLDMIKIMNIVANEHTYISRLNLLSNYLG